MALSADLAPSITSPGRDVFSGPCGVRAVAPQHSGIWMRFAESSILDQYAIKKHPLGDEYPQEVESVLADVCNYLRHLGQLFVVELNPFAVGKGAAVEVLECNVRRVCDRGFHAHVMS